VDVLADPQHTVAVLVANPALSSILSMTLAGAPTLRVRPFDSKLALTTYLHLAPADLVVADFDSLTARADLLAEEIRRDAAIHSRAVQIVALASSLTKDAKIASIHAGIDEIIMKPMSPRYLLERVLARLAKPVPSPVKAPETPKERLSRRRDWSGFGDNVVTLVRPVTQPRAGS
jgi:two-component system, OmpR family, phosphate regulon response regulator PhoB